MDMDLEGKRPGQNAPFTSVGPIASPFTEQRVSITNPEDLEFLDVGRSVSGWYNFGGIRSIRRFVSTRFSVAPRESGRSERPRLHFQYSDDSSSINASDAGPDFHLVKAVQSTVKNDHNMTSPARLKKIGLCVVFVILLVCGGTAALLFSLGSSEAAVVGTPTLAPTLPPTSTPTLAPTLPTLSPTRAPSALQRISSVRAEYLKSTEKGSLICFSLCEATSAGLNITFFNPETAVDVALKSVKFTVTSPTKGNITTGEYTDTDTSSISLEKGALHELQVIRGISFDSASRQPLVRLLGELFSRSRPCDDAANDITATVSLTFTKGLPYTVPFQDFPCKKP